MPAVVSALIGLDRLPIRRPQHINTRWRYVMFTDKKREAVGPWEQIIVPKARNPVRAAKDFKMCPWEFLPDEDFHLWIDGHCTLMCDPERAMRHEPLTLIHHWCKRQCIHAEAERVINRRKDSRELVRQQLTRYSDHPQNWGLWFGGFIGAWNTDKTREFRCRWHRLTELGSARDQLSLPVALRETGIGHLDIPCGHRRSYFAIGNK